MTLPRRALLSAAASSLGLGAAPGTVGRPPVPGAGAQPVGVQAAGPAPDEPGLHLQARRRGRFYGAAVDSRVLRTDKDYMAQVPVECGYVTSEAAFKWGALRGKEDAYSFGPADALLSYATRHGLKVRGHTLVWHNDNPDWLQQEIAAGNAERTLLAHVRTVAGHFRNRLAHWDVVNEVVWTQDGKPGGLRDSPWFRALGPRYIDLAFQACAETDPAAMRFINEDQIEYTWPNHEAKRRAILVLLEDLKKRNIPVDALGIQAHLEAGVAEFDPNVLARFVADVASLGLKIVITEMDVRDNRLPADIAARDAGVAAAGKAYLDAMLSNPAVLGVVTWGLSDRRTWLNHDCPRSDGLPQRALPLDTEMRRKPLWTAMGQAFAAAGGA